MAREQFGLRLGKPAYSDLSGKQYYAVTFTSNLGLELATAAKACMGILQNKPKAGEPGQVVRDGITKAAIAASQVVTAGGLLEVGSGGTLVPVSSGTAVAQALESLASTGVVTYIEVLLLPGSAAFA